MITAILDTLDVLNLLPTLCSDPIITPSISRVITMPNPFALQINFCLETKTATKTQIQIFNLRGQKIKTIQSGALPAGKHNIFWDGCDYQGKPVPSGIYLWRMENAQGHQQGKILKLCL